MKPDTIEDARAIITRLAETDLFSELSEPDLGLILEKAQVCRFSEGSFLFIQDDPAEKVFFVRSGRVKLHQITEDGQQIIMRMLTPGMLTAAISLVEGAVYPLSAEATEDTEVLCWSQGKLLEMVAEIPQLALNALKILASHVSEYQCRYRELATERVERRLARTILRLAQQAGKKTEAGVVLAMPVTRQELAEMSGTTLYSASRFLAQWERDGLISSSREELIIHRPHGLVSIAEDLPERKE